MNIVMSLLSNNGYIIVNKEIIKKIGLHEAIILGEMCSEYTYWERENKLKDGFFFSTRENIEENTGLSAYQQREPFKHLVENSIIIEKLVGMPQKKWYSLNMDKLYEIFKKDINTDLTPCHKETAHQEVKKLDDKESRNLTPSDKETVCHEVKKLDINNNKKNNKNNNKKESEQKTKYAEKVFLTKSNFDSLTYEYGKDNVNKIIEELDSYKKSTGKVYEDDYITLIRWLKREKEKNKVKTKYEQREYPEGFFEQFYANNQFIENKENKNIF